jgi:hypothetical protein
VNGIPYLICTSISSPLVHPALTFHCRLLLPVKYALFHMLITETITLNGNTLHNMQGETTLLSGALANGAISPAIDSSDRHNRTTLLTSKNGSMSLSTGSSTSSSSASSPKHSLVSSAVSGRIASGSPIVAQSPALLKTSIEHHSPPMAAALAAAAAAAAAAVVAAVPPPALAASQKSSTNFSIEAIMAGVQSNNKLLAAAHQQRTLTGSPSIAASLAAFVPSTDSSTANVSLPVSAANTAPLFAQMNSLSQLQQQFGGLNALNAASLQSLNSLALNSHPALNHLHNHLGPFGSLGALAHLPGLSSQLSMGRSSSLTSPSLANFMDTFESARCSSAASESTNVSIDTPNQPSDRMKARHPSDQGEPIELDVVSPCDRISMGGTPLGYPIKKEPSLNGSSSHATVHSTLSAHSQSDDRLSLDHIDPTSDIKPPLIKIEKCASSLSSSSSSSSSCSSSGSTGATGNSASSTSASPNPWAEKLKPRYNCEQLSGVSCHLDNKDLWDKFNELGTEMIITKSGR